VSGLLPLGRALRPNTVNYLIYCFFLIFIIFVLLWESLHSYYIKVTNIIKAIRHPIFNVSKNLDPILSINETGEYREISTELGQTRA
jgi:hypothetical protein